eukprot:TRINITY_DN11585_c0_g1_i1.p1 TRINITY_DN11585_c0_g1~~TRINITY_DN11585_c0_g1_i1.p1  ORF type:complete len:172 (+),score=32.85 TRINITY_DN11585_c0_g1_i1:78-593(+)
MRASVDSMGSDWLDPIPADEPYIEDMMAIAKDDPRLSELLRDSPASTPAHTRTLHDRASPPPPSPHLENATGLSARLTEGSMAENHRACVRRLAWLADQDGCTLLFCSANDDVLTALAGSKLPGESISVAVSYTHLRAHETPEHLVCRLLLEKKKTRKVQEVQICTGKERK